MNGAMHVGAHSNDYAVAMRGLTKHYGRDAALSGVDVSVPRGAVYVLVGANGAGKTTTLKVLMNIVAADAGSARVLGLDTSEHGPEVRAQIGYVPERHDTGHSDLRCGHLLRHAAAYYPTWDFTYADHLSRSLELRLDRRIGGLSKGETRRLQLVLALSHRPPLLLLDEPTDGLDPIVRRRVLTLLAEHLADSDTTVLISTHHVHELESLADHVGVLRSGRMVAEMPRDELQRAVHRYRLELPERWEAPAGLTVPAVLRAGGREVQWTLIGSEPEVTARLLSSGARVHEVSALSLEDAALAFLMEEARP